MAALNSPLVIQTMNKILQLTSTALLAGSALAQSDYTGPANLVFVFEDTVRLASANMNDAAIVGDDGVMYHSPGVTPFAYPYCDYGTWCAFFGDDDSDGQYGDSIVGEIDALHVPLGSPAPAKFFGIWFSTSVDVDGGGLLNGSTLSQGSIVRLFNDGNQTGVETVISQAQIITAANSSTSNPDVNGFTFDVTTGDMYFTFTANFDVNGTAMADGGVMRIPGSALTFGPTGLVTAVAPGTAEIVLTEAEVLAIFTNAGYSFGGTNANSDLLGIALDPTGGTYTSSTTNLTMPHLWLCNQDNADEGLVSTKNNPSNSTPGVVPSVNGVPLQGAAAFGLAGGFGGPNPRNPSAIAFQFSSPQGPNAMHCDTFPVFQGTTPADFNIDISGATPNGFVVLVFDLEFLGGAPGLFPGRLPVSPLGTFFGPSWDEYYPNIPALGVLLPLADPEGFARQLIQIPGGFGGFGAKMQAGDLATFTLSAPLLINWL